MLLRLAERAWPLQGLSDHGVSESLYLADPDANGLELYADRPAAVWPRREGRPAMFTARLNVEDLLATAPDRRAAALPPATRLGHVHLRVRDLAAAERFYTGELPLQVTSRDFPGARFFAAGDYHHHVGANTWGVTGPPAGERHAGLDRVTATARHASAPGGVVDPAGVEWRLESS